jgi:hypothetical protein
MATHTIFGGKVHLAAHLGNEAVERRRFCHQVPDLRLRQAGQSFHRKAAKLLRERVRDQQGGMGGMDY